MKRLLSIVGVLILFGTLTHHASGVGIVTQSGARCFNCSTGGSSGFTPQSNWTMTGTPSDGQIVTLTYSLGGLSIPTDPRPTYWAPLESSAAKDSTYSKSTTPFTLQTNASFQTTVKPTNAAGALDQLFVSTNGSQPGSAGPTDPDTNFFSGSSYTITNGKIYVSMKRYRDFSATAVGLNGKNFRIWDALPGGTTDYYCKDGFGFICVIEGTTADSYQQHGGSEPTWAGYHPQNSWFTDEYIYKQGTTGNTDGISDTARNGGWAYGATNRQFLSMPSDANLAKNVGFFSQYSPGPINGPPNNSHEYLTALYVNASGFFHVIVSSECTYRTTAATSDPGVIREVQLPVASSGSSSGVQILLRKGAYSSLSGLCLFLIDDNLVVYKVGQFTWIFDVARPFLDAANDSNYSHAVAA